MPTISNQTSLICATFVLALAIIGIISQFGKAREKPRGVIFAVSWGALLLSILVILSNDTFFTLLMRGLTKM